MYSVVPVGSGSEGHLEIRFFHLPGKKWHFVSFDRLYSLATSKFEIGDCVVEFDSGFLEIGSQRGELAENLALIFSVALIHVLCQPRPSDWAPNLCSPPRVAPGEDQPAQSQLPRLGGSEEIALLLAAGVLVATPCNHAIRNIFKRKKQQFAGTGLSLDIGGLRRQSSRSKDQDEEYELNGGPAVILHEAEVSAGWGEDTAGAVAAAAALEVAETSVTTPTGGAPLTVIQEDDQDSDEEQAELSVEAGDATDTTALLAADRAGEEGDLSGDVDEGKQEVDDDDQSEAGSEEVFDVEGASNIDADSQTGLFGNGEDDSDEVELGEEDEDETGFAAAMSSGDDEDDGNTCEYPASLTNHNGTHTEDCNGDLETPLGLPEMCNGGGEGYAVEDDVGDEGKTVESYYDEYYNIDGDSEVVNGFGEADVTALGTSDTGHSATYFSGNGRDSTAAWGRFHDDGKSYGSMENGDTHAEGWSGEKGVGGTQT